MGDLKSVIRGNAVDSAAGHVARKSEGTISVAADLTPTRLFQEQYGRKPSLHTPKRPTNLPKKKLGHPVHDSKFAVAHLIAFADLALILEKADIQRQPAHVTTDCPLTGKNAMGQGVSPWR